MSPPKANSYSPLLVRCFQTTEKEWAAQSVDSASRSRATVGDSHVTEGRYLLSISLFESRIYLDIKPPIVRLALALLQY